MLHQDRSRANSFGDDPELNDRVRPSYPPELIDRIVERQPSTALDVGRGTGIAARLLAARGVQVLAGYPRVAALVSATRA